MRLEKFLEACDGTMKRDGSGNGKDGEKKRKRKRKGTVDNAPDNGMSEAMKLPKAKWISSRINKILSDFKFFDKVDTLANNLGKVIKDMEKLSGRPEFGKKSSLGELIYALKRLEDKALDVNHAYGELDDIYNKATWEKEFKEINPKFDNK